MSQHRRPSGPPQYLLLSTAIAACAMFAAMPAAAAIPAIHKIMAFGDSITRGYGDTVDGSQLLCDQQGGYPPRLESRLAARGVQTDIHHSAVCGELTAEGLSRIDASLTLIQPEVTILMEGTNDFSQGGLIGIETIVSNVKKMADKVKARGGIPIVVAPPPRDPRVVNPEFEVDARAAFFEDGLEARAELENLIYVDQYHVFWDLPVDTPTLFEEWYVDPYHPNSDGYALMADAFVEPTEEAIDQVLYPFVCQDGEEKICLADRTFQVEVAWKTRLGETGKGKALRLTGDTAHFWFFNSANVELVVKVLDGRDINDAYWVFYGALSDVEYTITVTDTRTGRAKVYRNAQGNLASLGDTGAFPGTIGQPNNPVTLASRFVDLDAAPELVSSTAALTGEDERPPCAENLTTVCLNQSRFSVKVRWKDPQGQVGDGKATRLTTDTGHFWFFSQSNVELMLKVLDGRHLNGHFWVFFGSLTNVEFTIDVTDTVTGITKTYQNPQGRMASVADTGAFQVPASP